MIFFFHKLGDLLLSISPRITRQCVSSDIQTLRSWLTKKKRGCISFSPRGGGGGYTSIYGLDRYVPPDRVWFLSVSILK